MSIIYLPIQSAYGQNIKPFDGALLYVYEVGTTTLKTVYSDKGKTVALDNPVEADSRGRWPAMYISGLYKLVCKDKNGVTIWTEDNLQGRSGDVVYESPDFDSTTNSGDYPASGEKGDLYYITEEFTLNSTSGSHNLNVGDYIICNKDGATGIDADWNILKGIASISPVFNTMSELLTADTDTSSATITGFYSSGDGGGGVFVWDSTGDKGEHNGGTIIDPDIGVTPGATGWWTATGTGAGVWKRVFSGTDYYVEWFGAKGDDPGDGTGTDDLGAINGVLAALSVNAGTATPGGGSVVFDSTKNYRVDGTITLDRDTLPDGTDAALIPDYQIPVYMLKGTYSTGPIPSSASSGKLVFSAAETALHITGTAKKWRGQVHVKNLVFDGNDTATTGWIVDKANTYCTFTDCNVVNVAGDGINITGSFIFTNQFIRVSSHFNTGYGWKISGNALKFQDCTAEKNGGGGVYFETIAEASWVGGMIQYNASPQVKFGDTDSILLKTYFEGQNDSVSGGAAVLNDDPPLIEVNDTTIALDLSCRVVQGTTTNPDHLEKRFIGFSGTGSLLGANIGPTTMGLRTRQFSIRDPNFVWNASGSGTNEYYLQLAAGGDPAGLIYSKPTNISEMKIWENGSEITKGTVGSLLAGEWDYDDNDTLGYDTIYVRLTDSADPDSKAVDYLMQSRAFYIIGDYTDGASLIVASSYNNVYYALGDEAPTEFETNATKEAFSFVINRVDGVTVKDIEVTDTLTVDTIEIDDDELVINESGSNVDFRVESDTRDHALFVQGATGEVGINKTSPDYDLDVGGSLRVSSKLDLAGPFDMNYGNEVNNDFKVRSNTRSNAFFINADGTATDGYVGINKNTPAYDLDVLGNIKASGKIISSNLCAETLSIADDGVDTLTPSNVSGIIIINARQTGYEGCSCIVVYDSTFMTVLAQPAAVVETALTALSGTTGSDTKMTVSYNGGTIYIENRTGGTISLGYTLIGT